MTRSLNLNDIQGNVLRAYGRYSFPFARYFFLNISDGHEGRAFIDQLRHRVTTGARWPHQAKKPQCTVNIGFTYPGLAKLEVSQRTLQSMPHEFVEGMKNRAYILGDRDNTKTEKEVEAEGWDSHWDPLWRNNRDGAGDHNNVHMWISLNAQLKAEGTDEPVDALEETTQWLRDLCAKSNGGVKILPGIGRDTPDQDYLQASTVFDSVGPIKVPTPKEHFGFADGIGDPVFAGQYPPALEKKAVIGRGKRMNGKWEPIATGEFILGHPDESQELPPAAVPPEFSHNGTFMAFRKLHENVKTFDDVLNEEAESYANINAIPIEEARETLRAKMCGRWVDGVPLAVVPTYAEWLEFRDKKGMSNADPLVAAKAQYDYLKSPEASDFRYADDMAGVKCPGGSHLRRVNTRDYLDPINKIGTDPATKKPYANENASSALNKRRRVLRRGLPYGNSDPKQNTDETEQGVAMMLMGSSLFRQFEFVQQQWIEYGLDFHQGNNTCPLLGNHDHHKRHTIASDPASGRQPYVMSKLKTFVECRGGDYFFIPSMTALRMIAMGIVDPT